MITNHTRLVRNHIRIGTSFAKRYLRVDSFDTAWDMICTAWSSVAVFCAGPIQDFLNLGTEARMNFPGKPAGNWVWRMDENALTETLRDRILELNRLYAR